MAVLRPGERRKQKGRVVRVSVSIAVRVLMALLIGLVAIAAPVRVVAQEAPGVTGPNSYESPQFGYEVEWSGEWIVSAGSTTSEADQDMLVLDIGTSIRVQLVGVDPGTDPADLLDSLVAPFMEGELFEDVEVTELESESGEVAVNLDFTIGDEPARQRIEARLLPSGDAVVGVRLSTRPDLFEAAFADATENILIDGDPAFTNQTGVTDEEQQDEEEQQEDESQDPEDDETSEEDDGPAGDAATFDLAAIPFPAAEIEDEGWVAYGGEDITSAAPVAQLAAEARGGADEETVAEYEEQLEEWGWQRNYFLQYVREESLADAGYTDLIQVVIDQYEDASGAEESFAFFSDPEEITAYDAELDPDAETFGDESNAITLSGEADTGEEFAGAAISFRVENLDATVAILDYDGDRPRVSDIEPLAALLQERMEAALDDGTETLGLAAISVEGDAVSYAAEHYLRLDGETIPFAGETPDAVETRDAGYGNAEAVYAAYRRIAAGDDGFEDDATVNVWLYRFTSERRAGAWFEDLSESLQLDENIAPDLGDGSVGYPTELDLGAAGTATGYVIYALSGAHVALIDVNAVGGVELETVEALVEEQLACLDEGACEDPIPVPEELAAGAPDTDVPGRRDPAADTPAGDGAVVTFLGNLARTGVLPGPAPGEDREIDWSFAMGDATTPPRRWSTT